MRPDKIFVKLNLRSFYTLYGRKNSLLARRKLDKFPYLQYSTITISGPGDTHTHTQTFLFVHSSVVRKWGYKSSGLIKTLEWFLLLDEELIFFPLKHRSYSCVYLPAEMIGLFFGKQEEPFHKLTCHKLSIALLHFGVGVGEGLFISLMWIDFKTGLSEQL